MLLSPHDSAPSATFSAFLQISFSIFAKSVLGGQSPSTPPSPSLPTPSTDDELIFVQTIWRHGDRTPVHTFPNDPNREEAWSQGFGQLTTRGMAQHVHLGKLLRKRYIEELKLLSPQYSAKEIFVISTDTNRTIQSATANLIGMYSAGARWGIDYPDVPEWPSAFVPIPVHTYEYKRDPVGAARAFCQRTIELFDLIARTPEYESLNESSVAILAKVSEYAGAEITLSNLWTFIETVNIERTHGLKPPEYAVQILPQLVEFNTKLIEFNSGIGIRPFLGLDFGIEIPKMLGGTFLWEMIDRMETKKGCAEEKGSISNETPKKKTLISLKGDTNMAACSWMQSLKYYAHSTHDMTLAALFSTFQFDHVDFDREGFPGYAACVMIELWRKSAGQYYVKVLYRRDSDDDRLIDLTPHIGGCSPTECSLDQFRQRSQPFKPEPDTETLCGTPLEYRPVTASPPALQLADEDEVESNSMRRSSTMSAVFSFALFVSVTMWYFC